MKKRIYLAGPIAGLTYDGATNWRETVAELLTLRSDGRIECYSPMRGVKPAFDKNATLLTTASNISPMETSRGIMIRDYNDCVKADLVFVNFLGVSKISMGTVMEMGFAFAQRIPVVAIINKDNIHANHAMMEQSFDYKVDNLVDGVEVALSFLLP